MLHGDFLQQLVPVHRPVTVYLSRKSFEHGTTSVLRSLDASRDCAVVYLRLRDFYSILDRHGPLAARRVLNRAAATLLSKVGRGAAAHLGHGTFAVRLDDIGPLEAEDRARVMLYALAGISLPWLDKSLSTEAYAGLAFSGVQRDGGTLLAVAQAAGGAARDKFGWKLHVAGRHDSWGSEGDERVISSCQLGDIISDLHADWLAEPLPL